MLLTLVARVGSLLRAALGPKTGHPWSAWGYYNDEAIALPDFFGSPFEGEPWEGKHFMFRASMPEA